MISENNTTMIEALITLSTFRNDIPTFEFLEIILRRNGGQIYSCNTDCKFRPS